MIAVIDYGLGNPGSIANMIKAIGEKSIITDSVDHICSADKLILPGVGAFDSGMKNLKKNGLAELICQQVIEDKKPLLGICLGMQLLGNSSEEGEMNGLGLIPFVNKRFHFESNTELKIPHMGWDVVEFQKQHWILDGLTNQQRYYFVHSYHAVCDEEYTLMTCHYGYPFTAAVVKENIVGVQFHPEKSHDFGMALLKNYIRH